MNKIMNISEEIKTEISGRAEISSNDTQKNKYGYEMSPERTELIKELHKKQFLYHVTITFNARQNEFECEKQANRLLRNVMNKYVNKRTDKSFMSGFVFREYSNQDETHYHILMDDHPTFWHRRNKKKDFRQIVESQCFPIKKEIKGQDGKYQEIHPISPTGVTVQKYYRDNLEEYLTKSLENLPKNFDFIEPMALGKFEFIDRRKLLPLVRHHNNEAKIMAWKEKHAKANETTDSQPILKMKDIKEHMKVNGKLISMDQLREKLAKSRGGNRKERFSCLKCSNGDSI